MSMFSHLRQLRKAAALAALVWLPMSVFAQVCATHALVANIGGSQHPEPVIQEDINFFRADQTGHVVDSSGSPLATSMPPLAVVDAAVSCRTVDDHESGCDMMSVCAFASLAVLVTQTPDTRFVRDTRLPSIGEIAFSSRSNAPDVPPPRFTQ